MLGLLRECDDLGIEGEESDYRTPWQDFFYIIKRHIRDQYFQLYRPDGYGYDSEDFRPTLDGNRIACFESDDSQYNAMRCYHLHSLTVLSFFLGLPNHPDSHYHQSWGNLWRNFIGLRPKDKAPFHWLSPFFILWHLFILPFKALHNMTRIFTELLPQVLFRLTWRGTKIFIDDQTYGFIANVRNREWHLAIVGLIFALELGVISLILGGIAWIGTATTSPIETVQQNWILGNKEYTLPVAVLLVVTSILLTLCVYSTILPLVAKFVATSVLPYLAQHLPFQLVGFVNGVVNAVYPELLALSHIIAPIIQMTVSSLTFGLLDSLLLEAPVMLTLGALSALAIITVGLPLRYSVTFAKNKWYLPSPKSSIISWDEDRNDPSTYEDLSGRGIGRPLPDLEDSNSYPSPAAARRPLPFVIRHYEELCPRHCEKLCPRHCEKRSDEAIQSVSNASWIASSQRFSQ